VARQPELPVSQSSQAHSIDLMGRMTGLKGRQKQMGFGKAKKVF
jgi:hypothetical protein